MKTVSNNMISVILMNILILCIANSTSAGKDSDFDGTTLSVRESLIPMYASGDYTNQYYSDEWFPLNRINPLTKEYVRFYLTTDNESLNHICGAIWLLGFIGDKDDIIFIDLHLTNTLPTLINRSVSQRTQYLKSLSKISGCFAGMMIKRNVDGADAFFKKYANVSSWVANNEKEDSPERIAAQDYYSYFIMSAYQYSKASYIYSLLQDKSPFSKPYLHELFIESLGKIEIDKYTEIMMPKTSQGKEQEDKIKKCLDIYGEWIDLLMRKETFAQWRKVHLEKQEASRQKTKTTVSSDSNERVLLSNTVERNILLGVAREALKSYVQVSKSHIVRGTQELPIKRDILLDIQKEGRDQYEGIQIKYEVSASVNEFGNPNQAVVRQKEHAAVSFTIRDTAAINKKYAPNIDGNANMPSRDGDIKIHTKRINNTWYWDPEPDAPAVAMIVNEKLQVRPSLKKYQSEMVVTDIVDDAYCVAVVHEAIAAYTQIAKSIVDGNVDPLQIPVLNGYKIIPPEKRGKSKDKMMESLAIEKKILEELLKAKADNYGDYRASIVLEATLGNYSPVAKSIAGKETIEVNSDDGSVTVEGYESTVVTFMIRNAAELYKKHAPENSGHSSIDIGGNLQVYMKRINGKWYWNPFGW